MKYQPITVLLTIIGFLGLAIGCGAGASDLINVLFALTFFVGLFWFIGIRVLKS